jgi:hypothetical protein
MYTRHSIQSSPEIFLEKQATICIEITLNHCLKIFEITNFYSTAVLVNKTETRTIKIVINSISLYFAPGFARIGRTLLISIYSFQFVKIPQYPSEY